ncbi:MAG: hypothetical protein NC300_09085 [Bacteroidales bacterium]|nr:hypothetical protein [Clostridium sp.]MCM1204284.1 hypothetical protein [Bacteroidales bacterium]
MRLDIKRKLMLAGMVLFMSVAAITSQAASSANFSTGDDLIKAYGNGNINSAVFTYGGFRTGSYDNKYAVARMFVDRAWYAKSYENGRKLERTSFSRQRNAAKKDEEGIRLILRTYDSNGTKQRSISSRVIRCR